MFWRFSYSTSQIQTLLEKQEISLQEILDEDDVLQECKSNNEKLIEFLTQKQNMQQLVSNIVNMPSDSIDEKLRFKYSTISCELLTSDVSTINDALIENPELINEIYLFLNNNTPLNPLLASYFSKVIGSLISRKTEEFLNFIQSKEDFASLFIKHINTSAIMDVLLRLLTTIESQEMRNKVLNWLNKINLVQCIVELFSSEQTNEIHSNASQLLSDIVKISREQLLSNEIFQQQSTNNESKSFNKSINDEEEDKDNNSVDSNDSSKKIKFESNPLLDTVESLENLNRMMDLAFESVGKQNCSLVYALDVLLTLLEFRFSISDQFDTENNQHNNILERKKLEFELIASKGIKNVFKCCTNRLNDIHELLAKLELKNKTLNLNNGKQLRLFGVERLHLVKLLGKLISYKNTIFNKELVRIGILNSILDSMFEYKWNNFLHTQIANIIKYAFYCSNQDFFNINFATDQMETESESEKDECLILHILEDCNLVKKLLDNWTNYFDENKKKSELNEKISYFGHLIVISNIIWNFSKDEKKTEFFNEILKKLNIDEKWKELYETKITQINTIFSKDLVRNPHAAVSQINAENENDFVNNQSMNKNDLFNKLQNISFQMDSNDETENLFEQVCSQRDGMFLASEQSNNIVDEDMWVSREIKFSENCNSFSNGKVKEGLMEITTEETSDTNKNLNFDEIALKSNEILEKNEKKKFHDDFENNLSSSSSDSMGSSDEEQEKPIRKATEQSKFSSFENPQTDQIKENQITAEKENFFQATFETNNKETDDWANFNAFSSEKSAQVKTDLILSNPWNDNEELNSKKQNETNEENWANFS